MNSSQLSLLNPKIFNKLSTFITKYGEDALEEAIDTYVTMKQEYICKTRASITKLSINDIYYLKIDGHHITVYTQHEAYQKYGSLNQELKALSPCGFQKCSQNCIVSISKIKSINQNNLVLSNGTILHMSRNYVPQIILAFNTQKN